MHFALLRCNQLISTIMKTKKIPALLHVVVVLIALLLSPPSFERMTGSVDGQLNRRVQVQCAFHERRSLHRQAEKFSKRPALTFAERSMVRLRSPLCLITAPEVVNRVLPNCARTGLRIVFPLVPSTSTSNSVWRSMGLPARFKRKCGTRASP